ncbi:unnamed protein product, partial [Ectocarpus fasciculatus]
WNSRRSTVYGTKGMCCCTQPLAAAAGNKILAQGGTAADAAVAMAACLNILEPCSTGIGGDAFALYYSADTKEVSCFNGNGKSPAGFTMEALAAKGIGKQVGQSGIDPHSGVAVTVPGAAQLWEDVVKTSGKLSMLEVLTPAIELGENGFPLGPMSARQWSRGKLVGEEAYRTFRPNGISPKTGELFHNRNLARTFREVAADGAKAFYSGRIADAIVAAVNDNGGMMTLEDLAAHTTNRSAPISSTYKGYRVYQTPPPSHGIATLIALNILEALPTPPSGHRSSAEQTHLSLECMRLAMADALQYAADPEVVRVPVSGLLSKEYARSRAAMISTECASEVDFGDPSTFMNSETVYFCCVDGQGNACSFINSNYMGFGTGIVPDGCGFTLQNRACNFTLDPAHPNCAAPHKRPYHTIIPCLMTKESDGSFFATLGVMGGFMQPQGQFQVIRNMLDFGMDPQSSIDAARWYINAPYYTFQNALAVKNSAVQLEAGYGGQWEKFYHEGFDESIKDDGETVLGRLAGMGHSMGELVRDNRTMFGRGQIILRNQAGVLAGASDPRSDGCALPLI